MASTKFPPAPTARVAPPVIRTAAMKGAAPVVVKAAPAPVVAKGTAAAPVVAKMAPPPAPSLPSAAPAGTALATALAGAPAATEAMKRETLVIAFVDLARFKIASRRVKDTVLVELLEDYYARVADGLKPAGGRVVKFMGDGALVVFPADRISQAARALLMLKSDVDTRLAKKKFTTPLVARVNLGEVMAGAIGPKGEKRYDVIGQAVNRTAAIPSLGEVVSLTSDAFAKLDAKTQKLFQVKGDYYVPA
jgi:adenylate cyclase